MSHATVHVDIDGKDIMDWDAFHTVFSRKFGFPDFYGRNMDAWIDCMTSLDCPKDGMSSVHAPEDGILLLRIGQAGSLKVRCPDIWEALNECTAFVNWRRMEVGEPPVLALAYSL